MAFRSRFELGGVTSSEHFWCVPYVGTKRKIAADLLRKIVSRHPKMTHLYDLFGGGAAMSSCAVTNAPFLKTIHYNEYDVSVYSLIRFMHDWFFYKKPSRWTGSTLPQEWYRWIDRDEFQAFKRSPTHVGGLMRAVWGFGQMFSYLCPDDMASYKSKVHNFIVDGSCKEELEAIYGFELPNMQHHTLVNDRRLHFQRFINSKLLCLPMAKLEEKLAQFSINANATLDSVHQSQQIHPLQRLYRMSNCQAFTKFTEITNLSYNEVEIPNRPETVIYLDPPYKGTAPTGYSCGSSFDYESFYDWCRKQPYPVYISEYDMPSDFTCIMEINVKVSLASYCHDKASRVHTDAVEKLFWNGKS